MQTKSLGGSIYFLLFIDDYSRMSWVYFLQHKSETFQKFQIFKAMVENQSACYIKVLRTDRDSKFISKEFNLFCEEEGIQRKLTTPYTPEQNGIAERKNRTIVEMARSKTSKPILGRSCSNIYLSIKHLTNKNCYESNFFWSMT